MGYPLHSSAYLCLLYWFYHYTADRNLAAEPEAGVLLLPISGRKFLSPLSNMHQLNVASVKLWELFEFQTYFLGIFLYYRCLTF